MNYRIFFVTLLLNTLLFADIPKPIVLKSVLGENMGQNYEVAPPDFMRTIKITPEFEKAVLRSINYFLLPQNNRMVYNYGDKNYTSQEMANSLKLFLEIAKEPNFSELLQQYFTIYKTVNTKGKGLITGYYAPKIEGSFIKTEKYNVPLYPRPKDLVTQDVGSFITQMDGKKLSGRLEKGKFVPYYTREEIEKGILKEKPILYLSSKIDAYFLQIQGSGVVELPDGQSIHVGYAGGNGHPYISAGKVMLEMGLIPSGKITMQEIRRVLESYPEKIDEVFNKNPNYVFFRLNNGGPYGNIGQELTARVSIAMDSNLIPKGGLAFVKTTVPPSPDESFTVVARDNREEFSQFMVVQDTGGAIRGGGRVDIFMGNGREAEYFAGQMAEDGEVFLIIAKKEALNSQNRKKETTWLVKE